MSLTTRDKIAHLLNRYGLGANDHEIDQLMPLGVDGAIDRLVNYQKVPSNVLIQPWEFVFGADGRVSMDSYRPAIWWLARMVVTNRPMEEKLTLFWHNHFAVSGSKIEFGPAMLGYLDKLRKHANGSFYPMLEAVAKDPAMLRWLDTDTSLKGRPNENFAREVMELFTLGIGNYTEKDIQEAARAFSGWGIRYPLYELGNKMSEVARVRFAIEKEMPMIAFQDCPELHDNGFKTVLGVSGPLTAEDILKIVAHHPVTAKRMSKKLWSFFAYENPEPELVDRVAAVWTKSNLDIKQTLIAMAKMPEFWSDRAMGTMIKSPIDSAIGGLRQVGAGQVLLKRRKEYASFDTPMDGQVFGDMYTVFRSIASQGLAPLFPPDVSGWRWGAAWVSASATLDRIRYNDFVFGFRGENSVAAPFYHKLMKLGVTATSDQIVDQILSAMSVRMPEDKRALMVAMVEKAGAGKNLKTLQSTAGIARRVGRLVAGSPEYQLC